MKGPTRIPSQDDLISYYNLLQTTKSPLNEKILFQIVHDTRWDPRLHEQVIQHFAKHWKEISAINLNREAQQSFWPTTLALTLEILEYFFKTTRQLDSKNSKLFKNWKKLCITNITKAPEELYYIGLSSFAGTESKKDFYYSTRPFSKWGYLCRDLPLSKLTIESQVSLYATTSRRNILLSLFHHKKRITINDYLEALDHSVSKRQAERDLSSFKLVRRQGRTKGSSYILLSSTKK